MADGRPSGRVTSAPSTRRSTRSGGTAARRRAIAISSSCSAITGRCRTCWRSTRDREGAVEGRPRQRPRLAQHAAGHPRPARRRAAGQLVGAHRRLRSGHRSGCCGIAGSERQTPIPSAVFHDGRIFLSRGYRNSDYMAIRPGGRGDVTRHARRLARPRTARRTCRRSCYYDGLLYMTNEVGVVTCARRATGGARVAAPARRRVLRVAGGRRRQDLLRQRDGRDVRAAGRADRRRCWRRTISASASWRRRRSPAAGSSCARTARCSRSADRACNKTLTGTDRCSW